MELTDFTLNCYNNTSGGFFKDFKEHIDDSDNIFAKVMEFNEPSLEFLKVEERMTKIIRNTIEYINEYETKYGPSICAYAFLKIYKNEFDEFDEMIRSIIADGNQEEEDVDYLNDNYIIPYNINYNLEDLDEEKLLEYNKFVAECKDEDCDEEASK